MNEQPLDDVVMTPQVGSSHSPGFIHMREASIDSFSALAQQPLSTLSPYPPPVLINRRFLFLLALPVAAPPGALTGQSER
jgi:hypothetical protein